MPPERMVLRMVQHINLDITTKARTMFLTTGNTCSCCYFVGIQFSRCCVSWCGVLSCFVFRVFFVCEWYAQRLLQRLFKWSLFVRSRDTFWFSLNHDWKPRMRCTSFIPTQVDNAATALSRPTHYVHIIATAYIDHQSQLRKRPKHDGDLICLD